MSKPQSEGLNNNVLPKDFNLPNGVKAAQAQTTTPLPEQQHQQAPNGPAENTSTASEPTPTPAAPPKEVTYVSVDDEMAQDAKLGKRHRLRKEQGFFKKLFTGYYTGCANTCLPEVK